MPNRRSDLPPPLPPETRTVGQVVAEAIRLYGNRFWPSLALGISPAVLFAIVQPLPGALQLPVAAGVGAVLMTCSYVGACVIASGPAPRRALLNGFIVGFLLWPPVALLPLLFVASGSVWLTVAAPALPILAWLAYVGMSVPAAVIERVDFRRALGRGMELGRADYVHVLGTLFTLVIAYHLSAGVLFLLLQGGSKLQLSVAGFVATLVISPTIFLGAALVYYDQAARADADKVPRPTERSADADLHPALDADGSGSADAEVEPEPAARGES